MERLTESAINFIQFTLYPGRDYSPGPSVKNEARLLTTELLHC